MNLVSGTGCTSVDIGVNANLELVDKFCYLGDMFTVQCKWRYLLSCLYSPYYPSIH